MVTVAQVVEMLSISLLDCPEHKPDDKIDGSNPGLEFIFVEGTNLALLGCLVKNYFLSLHQIGEHLPQIPMRPHVTLV